MRRSYPTKDQYIQKVVAADYSFTAYMLNMVYRYIPFLFEVHQILDWAIHNTSLSLVHWFKVYVVHAVLYDAKCRVGSTNNSDL